MGKGKKPLELPDDFIIDILSRVPEKDLIRFTCVSKSWRSLTNPDSYLSQLRSHRTVLLDRPFLIIQKHVYVSEKWLYYNYWLELDSIEDGNPKPRELPNPFDHDHDRPRQDASVEGSCDGLVVLQQRSTHKMVVLNPATKKHHVVPPNPAGDHNVRFIGFGYDLVHACYKLVTKIKYSSRYDPALELMIYNVNDCTWKKSRFEGLDDDCSSQLMRCSGECVDGALYWSVEIMDSNKFRKIICFVLAEEEFHDVDPPHSHEVFYNTFLTVFDGRLCLVCKLRDERIEIWLMECDYRRRQSGSSYSRRWVKFLLMSDLKDMLPSLFHGSYLVPISFSPCENKILFDVNDTHLFWYDIGKNEFDELKNCNNKLRNKLCPKPCRNWDILSSMRF